MAGFFIAIGAILVIGLAAGGWVWFSIPKIHREMKENARAAHLPAPGPRA
jgi:hypothetical protein